MFGAKECSPFTNIFNKPFPQRVTGAIDATGGPNGWVLVVSARIGTEKIINVDIEKNGLYAPSAYFEKERGACSRPLIPVSVEEYKRLTQ